VKKGCLAVLGIIFILFVAGLFVANNPKIKKQLEDERKAKVQEAEKKQSDWEEGWRKWAKEGKEQTDKRAKEAHEPGADEGFQLGFMGAKLTRSKTNIAPSNTTIDRLANEQLGKQNVEANAHAGFVRGFKAGWSFGWISK